MILPWDDFVSLSTRDKEKLASVSTPLHQAMATLLVAEDQFGIHYLSAEEIQRALENVGVSASTRTLVNALARSGGRVARRTIDGTTKYRVMAAGKTEVQPLLERGDITAVYVEGEHPRTAHRKLEEILSQLSGLARVCDPYLGIRTLNTLELFPARCEIRLLTSNLSGNQAQIRAAFADFRRERPEVEVRVAPPPNTIHDRYILWADRVIFVGHGLKDIGTKESVIVSLAPSVAPGLAQELARSFEAKWLVATPL